MEQSLWDLTVIFGVLFVIIAAGATFAIVRLCTRKEEPTKETAAAPAQRSASIYEPVDNLREPLDPDGTK